MNQTKIKFSIYHTARLIVLAFGLMMLPGCNLPSNDMTLPSLIEEPTTIAKINPTAAPAIPPTRQPAEHVIGVRMVDGDAEFYNRQTGEKFVPRGSNYIDFKEIVPHTLWEDYVFGAGTYRPEDIRAEFKMLAGHGYNTVRLFFDHCYSGPSCIGNRHGVGLNPVFLDNMAHVMNIAADEGLFLLLTANGVPLDGNYFPYFEQKFKSNPNGFQEFNGNAYYLHEAGVAMQEKYWHDLMSGLVERNAPFEIVFAWQLQNEYFVLLNETPLSRQAGKVTGANGMAYDMSNLQQKHALVDDNVVFWAERISAVIRQYDPNTLITIGFFPANFPNEWGVVPDWYRNPAAVIDRAPVDFWDFHIYPEPRDTAELMRILTENLGMLDYTDKPVIMGEFGAFRHYFSSQDLAAVRLQEWMTESCKYGFDGWLIWEHKIRPADDAVWSMVETDHMIMKALAPVNWPDPCSAAAPVVEFTNLALFRPVRVSAFYKDTPGSGITDGSLNIEWASGTHGSQWVEIDLEKPHSINRVKLFVAQDPAGNTQHIVWAIRADGSRVLLGDLRGYTRGGDILQIALPGMVHDVVRLRVETPVSNTWVAWREIEVYSDRERQDDMCFLSASGNVTLYGSPGLKNKTIGSLLAGRLATADGYAVGEDGFTWYHLPTDVWIREDKIVVSPACQSLPLRP
jgi:hypothetical protein